MGPAVASVQGSDPPLLSTGCRSEVIARSNLDITILSLNSVFPELLEHLSVQIPSSSSHRD